MLNVAPTCFNPGLSPSGQPGNSHQPQEMVWVSSLHARRPMSARPSRLPREPPQGGPCLEESPHVPTHLPAAHVQPVTFSGRSWRAPLIHAATATVLWALGRAGPQEEARLSGPGGGGPGATGCPRTA